MALSDLWQIVNLPGYEHLRDKPYMPAIPKRLIGVTDIFAQIREGDILLHHPYESFDPVIQFLPPAAEDEKVLAIKATLYRTSGTNSPIVRALLTAAENEKQVAVVIELKARFDEQNNIEWAKRLEPRGLTSCMVLPIRRCMPRRSWSCAKTKTASGGTCTLEPATTTENGAPLYRPEPLYLSSRPRHRRCRVLQRADGLFQFIHYEDLWVAPVTFHRELIARIDRETEHARAGRTAGIRAKINAITEGDVVRGAYRASQAGVPIDLLVRGMCVLRPSVPE